VLNRHLASTFTSGHPGLPHIRALRVDDRYESFNPNGYLPALFEFLSRLPKNSLCIFE
jgi:hypothetical protein